MHTVYVIAGGLLAWLWPIARRRTGEQYQQVQQSLADARQAVYQALDEARQRGQREAQALVADRDQQIAASEQRLSSIVDERERACDEEVVRLGTSDCPGGRLSRFAKAFFARSQSRR